MDAPLKPLSIYNRKLHLIHGKLETKLKTNHNWFKWTFKMDAPSTPLPIYNNSSIES